MGQLWRTDGSQEVVLPANGKSFMLEELQRFVGGYIELVPGCRRDKPAYCNEEGRLRGLPFNELASHVFRQELVGDVIVCDSRQEAGGE